MAWTTWAVLCAALALGACGGDDAQSSSNPQRLNFRFFGPDGRGVPQTQGDVDALRVTVLDTTRRAVVYREVLTEGEDNTSAIESLPYGDGLQFFFEGLSVDDEVLLSGGLRPLDVAEVEGEVASVLHYVYLSGVHTVSRAQALFNGGEVADSAMSQARAGHAAVTLADGRVLLIGGGQFTAPGAGIDGSNISQILTSILVYDVNAGGYFDAALASDGALLELSEPRVYHTATLLADGDVLVTGGLSTDGATIGSLFSVELIQVNDDGTFDVVPLTVSMSAARAHHTATLLADGRVLLMGGQRALSPDAPEDFHNTADLVDPFQTPPVIIPSQPMIARRSEHSAVALSVGQVLACGGRDQGAIHPSCELAQINAETGQISFASLPFQLQTPRYGHVSLRLPQQDGAHILYMGGMTTGATPGAHTPTNSVEVLTLLAGNEGFTTAPFSLSEARAHFDVVRPNNGESFIVIGGQGTSGDGLASIDRFTPTQPGVVDYQLAGTLSMVDRRYDAAVATLPAGQVLISGGTHNQGPAPVSLNFVELYNAGLPASLSAP